MTRIPCFDRITLLRLEDGALTPAEADGIHEHLGSCPRCRTLAAELGEMGAAAARFADTRAAGADACPDALVLASYAEGRPNMTERADCEAHLAACGRCAADLAALGRELAGLEIEPGIKTPAWALSRARALAEGIPPRVPAPTPVWTPQASTGLWAMALTRLRTAAWPAAAIASFALIVLIQLPEPGTVGPALRGGGRVLTPEIVLTAPAQGASLVSARGILSWEPIPGAGSYRITIVDVSGGPIWTSETSNAQLALPATLPIEPGASYSWWVKTLLDSGEEIESPIGRFTVPH